MLRALLFFVIQRLVLRVMTMAVRLFVLFGVRFELPGGPSLPSRRDKKPEGRGSLFGLFRSKNTAGTVGREKRRLSSSSQSAVVDDSGDTLVDALPTSCTREFSLDEERVALALSIFLGHRLPCFLFGQRPSIFKHSLRRRASSNISSTNTASVISRVCRGVTIFHSSDFSDSHGVSPTETDSAVVVVCMPWNRPVEDGFERFCLSLSASCQQHVALVVVPIDVDANPKNNGGNADASSSLCCETTILHLIHRVSVAARNIPGCNSIAFVASELASTFVLQAITRSLTNASSLGSAGRGLPKLPPVRSLLLIDPFVGVRLHKPKTPQGTQGENKHKGSGSTADAAAGEPGATAPTLPAAPKSQSDQITSFALLFQTETLKSMLIEASLTAASSSLPCLTTSWFPAPLDEATSIPILVVYDVDGLWVEELQWFFDQWPNFALCIDTLGYRLTKHVCPPQPRSAPINNDTAGSEDDGWDTSEYDIVTAHMESFLRDIRSVCVSTPGIHRTLSEDLYRPTGSNTSTPYSSLFTRRRCPQGDDGESSSRYVSVDSMDHVFQMVKPELGPLRRHPSQCVFSIPAPFCSSGLGPQGPFSCFKPPVKTVTDDDPAATTCQQKNHTPPRNGEPAASFLTFWSPIPTDTFLPRNSSSGAHLDSLGLAPSRHHVLASLPHVESRSLASDEILSA